MNSDEQTVVSTGERDGKVFNVKAELHQISNSTGFNIPVNTLQVISEMIFPSIT